MAKINCWEFKKCGREEGGDKTEELGVCPATKKEELDGVHGGKNAGRSCWIVAGSMCGGKLQGTFAQKYHNCKICEFYQQVRTDEGGNFELSIVLLNRINSFEDVSKS